MWGIGVWGSSGLWEACRKVKGCKAVGCKASLCKVAGLTAAGQRGPYLSPSPSLPFPLPLPLPFPLEVKKCMFVCHICNSKHRDGLSSLNRRSTSGQKRSWHAQRSRHVVSALGESSWFLSSTLTHCICNHHVFFANNALKHPQHLCRSRPVIGEDRLLHVPYEIPIGVPLSPVLSNRRYIVDLT